MISKVIPAGKSFGGACKYLCSKKEQGEVILWDGVRMYDHKLMAADFEEQRRLNPGLQSPVQHIILSYYPGERINDEKMAQIAKEYMERINAVNTQFVVIKHTDKNHLHTHILFNRVNNEGKTIKDNWLGLRGKKVAQQLTKEHGLIEALNKNLKLTSLQNMNRYEATRYEVFIAVSKILPGCKNFGDLNAGLKKQKIEMIYKYKGNTQEVQGLSFRKGEFKYKGSEVDRLFSYKNLLKQINLQRDQKLGNRINETHEHSGHSNHQYVHHSSLLEELLKAERNQEQLPYELLKRKRKKGRSI